MRVYSGTRIAHRKTVRLGRTVDSRDMAKRQTTLWMAATRNFRVNRLPHPEVGSLVRFYWPVA